MRNLTLLFGAVLLVHGVFGACEQKSVFVMVGDSVTLNADLTKIKDFEELQWKIEGENRIIAVIDRENDVISVPGNNEERFGDRLKLDDQTGFLTITNIRTTDSKVYELTTKNSMDEDTCTFSVTVRDVFFVDADGVKTVSVMQGDTVTLHTGVTNMQKDDQIQWKFGDQDLNDSDGRWENIDRNHETGEITFRNIQVDQSGDYKMEIKTSSMVLLRKYDVTVGEMNTISVMEGEPITLYTVMILGKKTYDLILFKFKDHVIAEISEEFLRYDSSAGERFKGRLQLHPQTGSFYISDSRSTDSGDYHLEMISSSHTVQRNIDVTVKNSRNSESGISGASVALMVWPVTVFLLQV